MRHILLRHVSRPLHLAWSKMDIYDTLDACAKVRSIRRINIGQKDQIFKFIFPEKWHMFLDQFHLRNTMAALFWPYEAKKRGPSTSMLHTCIAYGSFRSSPTGSNKARDLKFCMQVYPFKVYHMYSGCSKILKNKKEIQNFQKIRHFYNFFFNSKFWKSEIANFQIRLLSILWHKKLENRLKTLSLVSP